MKYILILLAGFTFGQNYNTDNFNTNANLDMLQREIARQYTPKEVAYSGNKYFFKEPQLAFIELYETDKLIKVLTNYNMIDETLEVETDWKPLSLLPDKVKRVRFKEDVFVSINGKFYKRLFANDNFKLIADTYIKVEIAHYTPGIQEKPDPSFRRVSETYLYYKGRVIKVDKSRSSVYSMFGSDYKKEVKAFVKNYKLNTRKIEDLASIIKEFYKYLDW